MSEHITHIAVGEASYRVASQRPDFSPRMRVAMAAHPAACRLLLPVLVLLGLLPAALSAQLDELQLRDGTTVYGTVRYLPAAQQGLRLRFQSEGAAAVREYAPADILEYRLHDSERTFRTVTVDLPATGQGGAEQTRRRLGEVLATGELELIRVPLTVSEYTSEALGNQPYLYVLRQGEVELVLKLTAIEVYGQLHANPSRFRNLLKYLARGCARATELARDADFQDADILRVLLAYADCQPGLTLELDRSRLRGGMAFDHYLWAGHLDMRDANFSQSQLSLGAGYQLETRMTQRFRRISVLTSVNIIYHSFTPPGERGGVSQSMVRSNLSLAFAPVIDREFTLKLAGGLSSYNALTTNLATASANNYFLLTTDLRLYHKRWLLDLGYEFLPAQNVRRPGALLRLGVGFRLFPT